MQSLSFENVILPNGLEGFLKIWKIPSHGRQQLVVDKRNMILYRGADLLAKCLAGGANSKISHLYLAFKNDSSTPATISKSDTGFQTGANYNYLRVPLTLPASYTADSSSYNSNIVVFSIVLNNAAAYQNPSYATLTPSTSLFFGAALVATGNSNETVASHPSDVLFSKITFDSFSYTATENLAVSWGVKITA